MTNQQKMFIYRGSSMHPTLRAPDILHVVPYGERAVKRGDVIVFSFHKEDEMIVHRVISNGGNEIRTRGDGNNRCDRRYPVREDIVGRVVRAERGSRKIPIYGGLLGIVYASVVRTVHMIDLYVSAALHPVYHRIAQTGICRKAIAQRVHMRVLYVNRSAGQELHLLMNRFVIGRLSPGSDQWVIRRPFRLFIDAAALPHEASHRPIRSHGKE